MPTPRLVLGAGSTQHIISADASDSTYGGAARADMALRMPERFTRLDSGNRTATTVLVEINAADEDTLKSRYEELRLNVIDTTRDFDLQYGSGSSFLDMTVTDRTYVSVTGEMESINLSTVSALVAISFIGERAVLAAGAGSAGTIENPTGLQDAIAYDATFDDTGRLVLLVARATFVGATGTEAQERAGTWRALWASSLPGWLEAATTLRDTGAQFQFDSTKNECTCTLRLAADTAGSPEVSSDVTVHRYAASIQPHTLGTRPGEATTAAGDTGKVFSVSGQVSLRGSDEADFGGLTVAAQAGEAALLTEIRTMIDHAKSKAGADGAETLSPLSVEFRDNGWTAAFSYSALVATDVVQWTETVTRANPNPSTVIRSSDGVDRVYTPAGGAMRRVRVQWAGQILGDKKLPEPFSPPGTEGEDYVLADEQLSDPVYTVLTTSTAAGDLGISKTRTESGAREYLILSNGILGGADFFGLAG